MKFRKRSMPTVLGFQIAPMVDVLLVLLCFFIVTWSFAKKELDLKVRVPSAQNAAESASVVNHAYCPAEKTCSSPPGGMKLPRTNSTSMSKSPASWRA